MVTGALVADSRKVPTGRATSCAATLAVTVPLAGNKPLSKPSSVGVTVTLGAPAVICLVNVLSPTVTVTLVACGSMSVTVIPVDKPPSSVKFLVTVGVLGRATMVTTSFLIFPLPSIAAKP